MNCNQIPNRPVFKPDMSLEEFKKYQADLNYFIKWQEACQSPKWVDSEMDRYARSLDVYEAKEPKKNMLYYILFGLALILILFIFNK